MDTIPLKRTRESFIDLAYSPDDGGWYIEEANLDTAKQRVSKKLWPTKSAALKAFQAGKVRWEKWS